MQNVKLGAIIVAVITLGASIVTILGFPYQIGLLHPRKPEAYAPPTQPPAPKETEAWNRALASADCEAIRNYILDYPQGQFVSAAQTILSARREVTEERWITFEFPSNVVATSSLENRATRDTACASAREQMVTNMNDGCSVFAHQSSRYRSVVVVPPRNARCECQDEAIPLDGQTNALWRCSIRATYSCRGEQLQPVKRFVCG